MEFRLNIQMVLDGKEEALPGKVDNKLASNLFWPCEHFQDILLNPLFLERLCTMKIYH